MFPIRDLDGRTLGFAGLATHLGPSWPLWITSPKGDLFQPDSAIFAIERALPTDCRGRARADQARLRRGHAPAPRRARGVRGRDPASRSRQTTWPSLAQPLGIAPRDLSVVRNRGLDAVLVQPPGGEVGPEVFGPRERPYGSAPIAATIRSDWSGEPEGSDVYVEEEGPRVPGAPSTSRAS